MYTAIVIQEWSRQALLRNVFDRLPYPPSNWVIKGHHITVNMGPLDRSAQHPHIALNEGCRGQVDGSVLDLREEGVIAVGISALMQNYMEIGRSLLDSSEKVYDIPVTTINDRPHITIAHRIDVKPRSVNDYPDRWLQDKCSPYVVEGQLLELS